MREGLTRPTENPDIFYDSIEGVYRYRLHCPECGKPESDNITKNGMQKRLCVHHVDHDKMQGCNGKQWKLIPLCMECHGKIHGSKSEIETPTQSLH